MATVKNPIAGLANELAWSLWGELGVRGVVAGRHDDWSIDPEPLMVFTARLAADDPRLRDEALDWCIRYEQYISRTRLRGVLRRVGSGTREAFGPFAATLADHTNGAWPDASEPYRSFEPSGKSVLTSMTSPAMVRLRLRALFGVSARCEILHAFVALPAAEYGTAQLGWRTGYTKRNVQSALERLELAGLLEVTTRANRFRYRLRNADGLLSFVGARPLVFPEWEPVFRVFAILGGVFERIENDDAVVQAVELERALLAAEPDLDLADLPKPRADRPRESDPEPLAGWMTRLVRHIAEGTMPAWDDVFSN